jgi:hypothetical protein
MEVVALSEEGVQHHVCYKAISSQCLVRGRARRTVRFSRSRFWSERFPYQKSNTGIVNVRFVLFSLEFEGNYNSI